ncbi:MAG TPA: type II secretion system protein GspG [Chthonomonadaceae bacterium]|nr:type II secretion system protein GspG [Chthonomonadaceae bacterium]
MFMRLQMRRAFTLIELLVVIVVIAVLAAIVIPKFTDQGRRSKDAALKSNLALLRNAISAYQTDTGLYPLTLADLAATAAPANGADPTSGASTAIPSGSWHGPYIQGSIPNDPVSGSAFTYSVTAGTVGKVSSSATGNDSNGTAYSSY